ncbi:hypothetical protein IAI18_09025 [Acetobacteraceae bacterium H6797]|nr:hypothetical protein [Acetobacteraceae bacterium H6797]
MSLALSPPPIIAPLGGAAELASLVREALSAGASRTVLWLHLSRLPARLRKPHHRRLLDAALAPLGQEARLRRFDLPNGDVAAIAVPPARPLESLRASLATLFDEEDMGYLLSSLSLPMEAAAVMASLEEAMGFGAVTVAASQAAAPLSADDLAGLERTLSTADLTSFLRRQDICRVPAEGGVAEFWSADLRLPLDELTETLAPGRELRSQPALRRRLRRRLDERLLVDMARPDNAQRVEARSLSLSLHSLVSPIFLRLDAALPAAARREMLVFVETADILAHPSTMEAAGQFLATRGYRLGLDIQGPAMFDLLSPEGLGASAIRFPCAIARQLSGEQLRDLASRLDLILTGADKTTDIAWGWQQGLSIFQGRAVERRGRRG